MCVLRCTYLYFCWQCWIYYIITLLQPLASHQMSAPPFSRPHPRPPSSSHRRRTRQNAGQSSSDETDIYEGIHPAKPSSRAVPSVVKSDNENNSDVEVYEMLPEELVSVSASFQPPPLPTRPLVPSTVKSDTVEENEAYQFPPLPTHSLVPSTVKSDTEEEEEGYQPLVPTLRDTEQDVSEKIPDESHDAGTSGLESESAAEYIDRNDLDKELVELVNRQPPKPAPVSNGIDKSSSDIADNKSNDNNDYEYKDMVALVDNIDKDPDDKEKDSDGDKDSNIDDGGELTTTLLDNSVSEVVVTELLQSIISERESIVKTVELQKSHLKHELTKTHELEIKELQLKYKSRFKKLKLKHLEDGLALKAVIEKLQSELAGVYEQNSKLTRYMKESYRREEKFNKAITRLQQTVSSLELDLESTRSRETDLLANVEVLKEKLRKYELT